MPYSSPPLDGGRDNVSSTIDGEASGVSYGASNNQINTASHTSKKRKCATVNTNDYDEEESNHKNKLHRADDDDKSSSNNISTESESSASDIDDKLWLLANSNNISLLKRLAAKVIGEDYTPPDEREYNGQEKLFYYVILPLTKKLVDHYQSLPNGLQLLNNHVDNDNNRYMDSDEEEEEDEEELARLENTTSDSNKNNINDESNNLCNAADREQQLSDTTISRESDNTEQQNDTEQMPSSTTTSSILDDYEDENINLDPASATTDYANISEASNGMYWGDNTSGGIDIFQHGGS